MPRQKRFCEYVNHMLEWPIFAPFFVILFFLPAIAISNKVRQIPLQELLQTRVISPQKSTLQ